MKEQVIEILLFKFSRNQVYAVFCHIVAHSDSVAVFDGINILSKWIDCYAIVRLNFSVVEIAGRFFVVDCMNARIRAFRSEQLVRILIVQSRIDFIAFIE